MRGRNFFLAFFLAFATTAAVMLFLDTRPRDVMDLAPVSANIDSAWPVGDQWLLQMVVRSEISQPYYRSLLFSPQTSSATALPGFMTQYYPLGYKAGRLQLFSEQAYMPTLTGSLIMSRLNAPKAITGAVLELGGDGVYRATDSITLLETGLPFRCAGALRTADYGGSDTTYFGLDAEGNRTAWITVPDEQKEMPFCGADDGVYLQGKDNRYQVYAAGKISEKRGTLSGSFDYSGAWLGTPSDRGGCRYVRPHDQDYPSSLSQQTLTFKSECADQFYAADGVTAETREWQTAIFVGQKPPRKVHGKLIGLSSVWVLVQSGKSLALVPTDETMATIALNTNQFFRSFPKP